MRALILGSPVPQTARTVWRWLAAGHQIEELWCARSASGVWWRRDRRLRWLAPTWSLTAAVRRFGFRLRIVGPLRRDPRTVAEGLRPHVDVVLSSCFPYLVPAEMLEYYRDRACNLHPALLPRYRGTSPMPSMVFDEDLSASGVTLHLMASGFDDGDVIAQTPVAWPGDDWLRTWEADLSEAAGRLAVDAVPQFLEGRLPARPQAGAANYVRGLPPEGLVIDERIDQRRARWLGTTLGRIMPLAAPTPRGPIAASMVLSSQTRRDSRPAAVSWRRVECDVSDARLSVRRWSRAFLRVERARELAGLARRPLAA